MSEEPTVSIEKEKGKTNESVGFDGKRGREKAGLAFFQNGTFLLFSLLLFHCLLFAICITFVLFLRSFKIHPLFLFSFSKLKTNNISFRLLSFYFSYELNNKLFNFKFPLDLLTSNYLSNIFIQFKVSNKSFIFCLIMIFFFKKI